MRMSLDDFLSALTRSFVRSSQAGTQESVSLAENAHETLGVTANIGGVDLEVEGAANLPKTIMMAKRMAFKTSAFLDLNDKNEPQVTLKRGLLKNAPVLEIEMEFERSKPLESMELVRSRAVEIVQSNIDDHKILVQVKRDREEAANGSTDE